MNDSTKQAAMISVRQQLGGMTKRLESILPRHLNSGRLCASVLGACKRVPKLLDCDPESFALAVEKVAYMGWEVDGAFAKAYLIPFKKEVTVVPSYHGIIDAMLRSGQVIDVTPTTVWSNELPNFRITAGTNPGIVHDPIVDGERGHMVGFYAVVTLKGGHTKFAYMTVPDVDKIKARSMAAKKGDSPWKTDYEPMAWKTVIKRVAKYCPFSSEDLRIIEGEELPQPQPQVVEATVSTPTEFNEQDEHFRYPGPDEADKPHLDAEARERHEQIEILQVLAVDRPVPYARVIEAAGMPAREMTLDQLKGTITHIENFEESTATEDGEA